uniref:S-adenosyl-l-methionine hydroxide adenosyltransferase n=1 Tax=Candidatus Kentrum sp. UNK TaxID=2126344 RepID=A0A451AX34_9GAMM|nr:MAG: hypothetical protein BECKUNK1418G_GA0071005_102733 [Candidatus Kentron sp. UNK]VFK70616.1 MAG: hypothetical protein BECKUNK1418H_GA0071006_10343 [Candidatus Kentron sp. UNK]
MIILFTDFGSIGPYVGQVKGVLFREAPGIPVVDLMHDAPAFDSKAAAYLLAALVEDFPEDAVFLCVVDPGVGAGSRLPVVLTVDGRRFVGPNNGLFDVVARRGRRVRIAEITWRPARLSATFHGRDLFAPVAAMIARGESVPVRSLPSQAVLENSWPEDLAQIIYIDHFGNAMTGLRAASLHGSEQLMIGNVALRRAETFARVPEGKAFWYQNANGLAEIAINQGNAAQRFKLRVGTPVRVPSARR